MIDTGAMRKYLHDLSNALNAAKINAYLLRRIHGDTLDKETISGLDGALRDAEEIVSQFHEKVHAEMRPEPADGQTDRRSRSEAEKTMPK